MGKVIRFIDGFLLPDHEWKKKYCPNLYSYLFSSPEKQREMLKNYDPDKVFEEGVRAGVCGAIKINSRE